MFYKKIIFQFLSISNFFLNIYILFILLFFGNLDIVGEGFIVISLINVFTHGFSGNLRNIYLGSKKNFNIKNFFLFRVKMGIFGIICTTLIFYFLINKANIFFHLSLITLTVTNWIFELLIARNEKNNTLNFYHMFNVLIFVLFFPILIFYDSSNSASFIIYIFILFNIIIFNTYLRKIYTIRLKLERDNKTNFNLGVGSTFYKTVSNLIWRYSAYIIMGKSQSAILFVGFSLGSFYGTLFDVSYGALFLKSFKKYKKLFLNFFYLSYIMLIYVVFFSFQNFSTLSLDELKILYITTALSLIGAYFMVISLQLRQSLFEVKKMQNICFKTDIYIYLFNSMLIPVLYFIHEDLLVSAYLISSIFFYILYKITSAVYFSKIL